MPVGAQERVRGGPLPRPTELLLLPDTPRGHQAAPMPGNAFLETQRRLLFVIRFDRASAGQEISVRIFSVNTTQSNGATVGQTAIAIENAGTLPIAVSLPRNWPVGEYGIALSRNGQAIATLPFLVRPESPRNGPITVGEILVERSLGQGQFESAPRPRPSDRSIFFATRAQGSRTDGARITWIFTAVETAGGAAEVARAMIERQYIENTPLEFDVSMPRDWPVGRYRLDLLIDNEPAASREITIAP
ncbi:hypothetical protein [Roseomonas sp. HF4]|uniref:hypothetical protein n=1 Tax=Roseomonas sp. HF4 TaxID=2562313 RepID=UPI0010C11837|nr:hypothetical protein [Roseomonas sp. HF4]